MNGLVSRWALLVLLASMSIVPSCASVSAEEIRSANYGELRPDYQEAIKALMSTQLKDPYSAVYSFSVPRKGYCQDGWAVGGQKHFGYIVPTGINAKNSFGGFVGQKPYYFMIENGVVSDIAAMFLYNMAAYAE